MMNPSNSQNTDHLSDIVKHLRTDDKARYVEKCELIGACDPYLLPVSAMTPIMECPTLPGIAFPEIYLYLINYPSKYTGESMRAYKSLDAFKFYVSGKVNDVYVWSHANTRDKQLVYIVRSRVTHSMCIRDKPLSVWVALQECGKVITGHCDCMAGASEVCSHVAATLFATAKAADMVPRSCTSKPCEWNRPGQTRQVQYAEGSDINFRRPRHPLLDETPSTISAPAAATTESLTTKLAEYRTSMKDKFFKMLKNSKTKPALLSLVPGYSDSYVPAPILLKLPKPLPQLFEANCMNFTHQDLRKKCEEVFKSITFTDAEAVKLEEMTRLQSKSKAWFEYRAGRITASNLKSAVVTNPEKPSVSLIKRICYPQAYKFSTTATRWGCEHEQTAIDCYEQACLEQHDDLSITNAGFYVHSQHAFIGASPDAHVTCNCCGAGILEVKCPLCVKGSSLQEKADARRDFCLETLNNTLQLKRTHAYYYQIQAQLASSQRHYCDFVVWNGCDNVTKELFIERIFPDKPFFERCLEKAGSFFRTCVLLEPVGKWYTSVAATAMNQARPADGTDLWCFCRQQASDDMINCASENCQFQKFHLKCLGLSQMPRSKRYFCPSCKKVENAVKRKLAKRKLNDK